MSNWKEVVGDLYIKDKPVVNSKFQRKKISDPKGEDKTGWNRKRLVRY